MEAVFRKMVLLLAMLDEFPWTAGRLKERIARLCQAHNEASGGLLALHNPYAVGIAIERDLEELAAVGLVQESEGEWSVSPRGIEFLDGSGLLEFLTVQRKKAEVGRHRPVSWSHGDANGLDGADQYATPLDLSGR